MTWIRKIAHDIVALAHTLWGAAHNPHIIDITTALTI
jgi:hypothetical protein